MCPALFTDGLLLPIAIHLYYLCIAAISSCNSGFVLL